MQHSCSRLTEYSLWRFGLLLLLPPAVNRVTVIAFGILALYNVAPIAWAQFTANRVITNRVVTNQEYFDVTP